MTDETIHKEDAKATLRKRFGSVAAFERARGLPTLSVKDVFRGRASKAVEEAIAEELDLPLHRLFPDRWEPTLPGGSSLKRDSSHQRASMHPESAEAR